jgi:hypothetical protein
MNKLPKYFAIECLKDYPKNPKWREYIKWLNKHGETNRWKGDWEGNSIGQYYGTDDDHYGGTNMHSSILSFPEGAIELTLEQWDEIVNGKDTKFPLNTYIEPGHNEEVFNYLIQAGFSDPHNNGGGTLFHYGVNKFGEINYYDKSEITHDQATLITYKQFEQTYITPKTKMNTPTKDQILEAAKTSPEAKQALKKLFPECFGPRLMEVPRVDGKIGEHDGTAIPNLTQLLNDIKIGITTAYGNARKTELKHKSFYLSPSMTGGVHKNKYNFVIFDNKGEVVGRYDINGKGVHFGFEEISE